MVSLLNKEHFFSSALRLHIKCRGITAHESRTTTLSNEAPFLGLTKDEEFLDHNGMIQLSRHFKQNQKAHLHSTIHWIWSSYLYGGTSSGGGGGEETWRDRKGENVSVHLSANAEINHVWLFSEMNGSDAAHSQRNPEPWPPWSVANVRFLITEKKFHLFFISFWHKTLTNKHPFVIWTRFILWE